MKPRTIEAEDKTYESEEARPHNMSILALRHGFSIKVKARYLV